MRRRWKTVLALICGILPAACAAPPPPPPAGGVAIPAPPPPRPEPPRRAAPANTAAMTPDGLKGLSRDETAALLGQPSTRADLATGTVWTYRRGGCALSLLFYPEVETGVERVLGYEADGADPAACLKRLREAGGRHGR